MARMASDHRSEIKSAALLTLATVGGALAVVALLRYLSKNTNGKIALGTSSAAVEIEAWLKQTTSTLQRGSQSLIDRLDPR